MKVLLGPSQITETTEGILEPNNVANKWDGLILSTGGEIAAKSNSFFPLNPHCYINLLRQGKKALLSSEIWPTNCCNYNCSFCSSDRYGLKGCTDLDWLVMERLINDIADMGNKIVRFSGGGEPALHKSLGKAIKLVAKRNMFSCLITNGSALSRDLINLLTEHAVLLRFSFNAGDAETYYRVHGVNHFDRVVRKMSLAVEERNRKGRQNEMLLGLTFIITKDNFHTISKAAKIAKEIGFDFIIIRGHNPVKQLIQGRDREILDREISISHSLEAYNFFVKGKTKSLDGTKPTKPVMPICYATHFRAYVNFKGQVFPCFNGMCGGYTCGSIIEESIKNVWGKGEHLKIFNLLKKGKHFDYCQHREYHCGYGDFNKTMWEVTKATARNPELLFRKKASAWAENFMPATDWF